MPRHVRLFYVLSLFVFALPGCVVDRSDGWRWRSLRTYELRDMFGGVFDQYRTDSVTPEDPYLKERREFDELNAAANL